jgi:hypothetical protein
MPVGPLCGLAGFDASAEGLRASMGCTVKFLILKKNSLKATAVFRIQQ